MSAALSTPLPSRASSPSVSTSVTSAADTTAHARAALAENLRAREELGGLEALENSEEHLALDPRSVDARDVAIDAEAGPPISVRRTRPRACAIVPAYEAAPWITQVVTSLLRDLDGIAAVIVIDDGSHDDTAELARAAGAEVIRHPRNRGKGCAIRTGLLRARELGCVLAISVDADGQHPSESARIVLEAHEDPETMVLGVRDLVADGCPRPSQRTNAIANFWITHLSGRHFVDTQCGLRRYPVERALALSTSAAGYAYESEMLLRAVGAGIPIHEEPIHVHYPHPSERLSHFKAVPDVTRITLTISNVGVQEFVKRQFTRLSSRLSRLSRFSRLPGDRSPR